MTRCSVSFSLSQESLFDCHRGITCNDCTENQLCNVLTTSTHSKIDPHWESWSAIIQGRKPFSRHLLMLELRIETLKSNASLSTSIFPACAVTLELQVSSSVPKYRSPNSPMPGMTRKSASRDESISEVTIFSFGNFWHTAWIPCGDCIIQMPEKGEMNNTITHSNGWKACFWARLTAIRLRKMIFDSGTPLLRRREIAFAAEFPVNITGTSFSTMKSLLIAQASSFMVYNFEPEARTGSSKNTWRLAISDGSFS